MLITILYTRTFADSERIVYKKKFDPTASSGYYFSPLPCCSRVTIHCLYFLSICFSP